MNICIVTDTGADFTASLLKSFAHLKQVPLHFIFGLKSFDSGGLSLEEFDRQSGHIWPTTSVPSVGEYLTVYLEVLSQGYEYILCLPISGGLTGSYQAAKDALDLVDYPRDKIAVVDTRTISLGVGFLVEYLITMMKDASTTFADLVNTAQNYYKNESFYVVLNTLENLFRGGRATKIQQALSIALDFKPLLGICDGELKALERIRTFGHAMDTLVARAVSKYPIHKIGVMHVGNIETAQKLVDKIIAALAEKGITWRKEDIALVQVCLALYAHAGKGALGICVT